MKIALIPHRFLFRLLPLLLLAGCVNRSQSSDVSATPPRYTLKSDAIWLLQSPSGGRFDASALLQRPDGQLWTINDREAQVYRIAFLTETNVARLLPVPDLFTEKKLARYAKEKVGRYDVEGLAQDDRGRVYMCEEANRWILRVDPKSKEVERLEIDWSPVKQYFHPTDRNASFEGVAVGGGNLYVANERQRGRIIVVDLETLKVVDDFTVRPSHTLALDTHYSDLCWFDGALYALLRENRLVVKIDPKAKSILAEYSFAGLEKEVPLGYDNLYGTSAMEGLAVDRDFIWLVTDNNGRGRKGAPDDIRPSLVRCLRPDKQAGGKP